jgi:peptidoglycan/xylan/chitin deacetylase (PgdA/CDA1 family)
LKVDVDTLRGHTEGVPQLLRLLGKHSLRGSFFFSLGPDNSGRALIRILRPGFLQKMRRTGAASTYGLKTLFYGTLLRAPHIGATAPEVIRATKNAGHEVGLHAWDHVTWQDWLPRFSAKTLKCHVKLGREALEALTGELPASCAAPGWQITAPALEMEEECRLLYASDTRGISPFFPIMGGKGFSVLQLPTTLPTLDELWGQRNLPPDKINALYLEQLGKADFQVHTIHAEMEGMAHLKLFEDLLLRVIAEGHEILPLEELAKDLLEKENKNPRTLPWEEIIFREIPGRAGKVACQSSMSIE